MNGRAPRSGCRPPAGAKPGTFHWLRRHGHMVPVMWCGRDGWMVSGVALCDHAALMRDVGWRYVGPCLPPAAPREERK